MFTLALAGCPGLEGGVGAGADAGDGPALAAVTHPERAFFEARVQPVLAARCGGSGCHTTATRPFRVLDPTLLRLPGVPATAPLSAAELDVAYDSARSMIDAAEPARSPLLTKPLDDLPGGVPHGGGRQFEGLDDRQYELLRAWAAGETERWERAVETRR